MRVLIIENFQGTPPGLIGRELERAGITCELRRAFAGEPVPDTPDGYAGLVVLGGAQSALDDNDHPYLPRLAALTRKFGEADKAVLGICLGAQLVARGHGARNILGLPVEFGWLEVRPTAVGRLDPLIAALGEAAPLFHWHADTFTLPEGALHLATSAMTPHQAFRIGRAVYGVQFHCEADRALVDTWTHDFAETIADYAPEWPARHPGDAERYGAHADAIGAAIARAWIGLLQSRSTRDK
jgi:GMP synthase-like glutamine amidotransferase